MAHCRHYDRWHVTIIAGLLEHVHMHRAGCCKTTLARAAAGATAATFLPLSGAQLQSMYVGEGEAALRRAFARARLVAPSVIFIDELDSVAGPAHVWLCRGGL